MESLSRDNRVGVAVAGGLLLLCAFASPALAQRKTASEATSSDSTTATPVTKYERPDLSGVWVNPPQANGPAIVFKTEGNVHDEIIGGDPNAKVSTNPDDPDDDLGRLRASQFFTRQPPDSYWPRYKPEVQPKVHQLDHLANQMDPSFYCVPPGVPRIGPPNEIVQFPDRLLFLYGGRMMFRSIPIDKPHRTDLDPSLMGDPVAHWEGNTLVVDIDNFDDLQWLAGSGLFHTTDMHVIEKFTREGNTLTYQVTVEDPSILVEPWVRTRKMVLSTKPEDTLTEDAPCVDKDGEHLVNHDHEGGVYPGTN